MAVGPGILDAHRDRGKVEFPSTGLFLPGKQGHQLRVNQRKDRLLHRFRKEQLSVRLPIRRNLPLKEFLS